MYDVTIVLVGNAAPKLLVRLITQRMREKEPQQHKWMPVKRNYTVTADQYVATKNTGGKNSWKRPLFSEEPIHDQLAYIQIEVLTNRSPMFIGVSKTNNVSSSAYMDRSQTVCVYTNGKSLGSSAIRFVSKPLYSKQGDVIGIVIDKLADVFSFYCNGQLIANGVKKPSEMEPMYLALWMHNDQSEVRIVDKYPLFLLNKI